MSMAVSGDVPFVKRTAEAGSKLSEILAFVRTRTAPDQVPKVLSFGLGHHTEEGTAIVGTWTLKRKDLETEIVQIAQDLEAMARANVNTFPRPQRYGVIAYSQGENVVARWDFLLAPPPGNSIGGETEPANETGVMSQAMRFSESIMRIFTGTQQAMLHSLFDENQRLRDRCSQLEDRHFAMIKHSEELLDKKQERDLKLTEKQYELQHKHYEQERVQRFVGYAEQMVPLLLEKWGVKLPEDVTAHPFARFVGSLKPDQIGKLVSTLMPELSDDQANLLVQATDALKADGIKAAA